MGGLDDYVRGHVLDGLLDGSQHALVDAKGAADGPLVGRNGPVGVDGRELQLRAHFLPRRGVAVVAVLGGTRVRGGHHGGRVGEPGHGAFLALALLAHGGGLLLGGLLLLLQLAQGVLQHDLRVVVSVDGLIRVGRWDRGGVRGRHGRRGRRRRRGIVVAHVVHPADDLVPDEGADAHRGLDAHGAGDLLPNGGGAGVRRDLHEAGHRLGEVVDVLGQAQAGVAVAPLPAGEQAVALLEPVDPAGGELGRVLLLVPGELGEDGLGLLGQLLVGGLPARGLHLLEPAQHQLLDVGPVAEAQAGARQLRVVAVEARVLEGEGVRDGRLADVLAELRVVPLYAGLVRRADLLVLRPPAQGATLVQREGMTLLAPGVELVGIVQLMVMLLVILFVVLFMVLVMVLLVMLLMVLVMMVVVVVGGVVVVGDMGGIRVRMRLWIRDRAGQRRVGGRVRHVHGPSFFLNSIFMYFSRLLVCPLPPVEWWLQLSDAAALVVFSIKGKNSSFANIEFACGGGAPAQLSRLAGHLFAGPGARDLPGSVLRKARTAVRFAVHDSEIA